MILWGCLQRREGVKHGGSSPRISFLSRSFLVSFKHPPEKAFRHGVLDQLMYSLNCEPEHEHKEGSKRRTFKLVPSGLLRIH